MTDNAPEPTQPEREPIVQRFPELADCDAKDDDGKLQVFRNVLSALQHELDSSRQ